MNTQIPFFSMLLCMLSGCTLNVQAQSDTAQGPRDCTVLLQDGGEVAVARFWKIEDERVEYEHDGSLHDLSVADIRTVRCGYRDYTIVNDTLRPVANANTSRTSASTPPPDRGAPTVQDERTDYFAMGKADAGKYYHGGGAFAAGMLTSPLLIVPPIIAAVPPAPRMKHNPNAALYWNRPEYRKGYNKEAHEKKAAHAVLGMLAGITLLFILPALVAH